MNKLNNVDTMVNIQSFYEDYLNIQKELSNSKLKIINLEGQLVHEKEINMTLQKQCERSLHDIQHYKVKAILEKPVIDFSECNDMDVDLEEIFSKNEDLIKTNFDLLQKLNDCQRRLNDMNYRNDDVEMELIDLHQRNEFLTSSNEELKSYVDSVKEELLEMNSLKLRISELENEIKTDNGISFISKDINKINDLELKCFNLEKMNEKFKENHANLKLLFEENATLSNQNDRLKQKLAQNEALQTSKSSDHSFESNVDVSMERRARHVESENEILKYQQAQMAEQNVSLRTKIRSLEANYKFAKEANDNYHSMSNDKDKLIEIQQREIRCLTQDCAGLKQTLDLLAGEGGLDPDTVVIHAQLSEVFESVSRHSSEVRQQYGALDRLMRAANARLNRLESNVATTTATVDEEISGDRRMLMELRLEVERLGEELRASAGSPEMSRDFEETEEDLSQ